MPPPKEYLDLQQKFIRYLIDNGYPEETIVSEYKVDKKIVDVAIIDLKLNVLIAVFGLKTKFESLKHEYDYLHEIKSLRNIPIFLVIPKENGGFKVFRTFKKLDAAFPLSGRGLEEVDLCGKLFSWNLHALVLIPFASRLKILGLEFERLKSQIDKENG